MNKVLDKWSWFLTWKKIYGVFYDRSNSLAVLSSAKFLSYNRERNVVFINLISSINIIQFYILS